MSVTLEVFLFGLYCHTFFDSILFSGTLNVTFLRHFMQMLDDAIHTGGGQSHYFELIIHFYVIKATHYRRNNVLYMRV